MENREIVKLIRQLNVPSAYQSFKSEQKLPYIIYTQSGSDNFGADNKVYSKDNKYNIEVYSSKKDFDLERRLEDLLDNNEIYWTKSGDIRIEKENMTEVIYFI